MTDAPSDPAKTTRLLRAVKTGDAQAADQLLPLVYDELHRMAGRLMGQERGNHTLQPTALLNEAWRVSQRPRSSRMRSANSTPPVGVNRAKRACSKRRNGRRSASMSGDQVSTGSVIASRQRIDAPTQSSPARATTRVPVA
jgi:hypothetical protein